MKHTKGKWIARIDIHYIDVIEEKTGFGICDIGTINDLKLSDYPIDEAKANAKLISKAPEMYEALYSIREWHIAVHEHGKHKHFPLSKLINLLNEMES